MADGGTGSSARNRNGELNMAIATFTLGVCFGFVFGMLLASMFIAGRRSDAVIAAEEARKAGLL